MSEHRGGDSDGDSSGDDSVLIERDGFRDVDEFGPRRLDFNFQVEGVCDEKSTQILAWGIPFCNRSRFEADQGIAVGDEVRLCRAWKLLLLLPRMLLHKPARGGLIPKEKLKERFNFFPREGSSWRKYTQCDATASKVPSRRRRRHEGDSLEKRADRVLDLVHMGEFSAARHALDGAPIAPGNEQTLNSLRDRERRPTVGFL